MLEDGNVTLHPGMDVHFTGIATSSRAKVVSRASKCSHPKTEKKHGWGWLDPPSLLRSEKATLSEDLKLSDDCRLKVSFPSQLLPTGDAFPQQSGRAEVWEVDHTSCGHVTKQLNWTSGHALLHGFC